MRHFADQPDAPDYLVCTNTNDYPANANQLAKRAGAVIACDGAHAICRLHGIIPDLVIGDFDSSRNHEVKRLQISDQNRSDTQKALDYITRRTNTAACSVMLLGLGGGRYDHSLYHLRLMWEYRRAFASLDWMGAQDHCRLIERSCVIQGGWMHKRISLFAPWGKAVVTLPDAFYPVRNYTLSMRGDCSLSNAFNSELFTLDLISGNPVLLCIENDRCMQEQD